MARQASATPGGIAARVQAFAETGSAAERGAALLAELHEQLSVLAVQTHNEDWPVANALHHTLLALADVQRRLVALVDIVDATIERARLFEPPEDDDL